MTVNLEPRRRQGLEFITELRKWAIDPSEIMFNGIMTNRLLDASTYEAVDTIVVVLEERLHKQLLDKLTINL